MYLAIDVGGSKTLLAVFSERGQLVNKQKIKTDPDYSRFLSQLETVLGEEQFKKQSISYCCCAIPGRVDRQNGVGVRFGNLTWQNVPIKKDLENIMVGVTVWVENDAKLGGLYEAVLVHNEYKKVLYLTIGTGIGIALITNGVIDLSKDDAGGRTMMLQRDGKKQGWEDLSSGRAIMGRYGQKAQDINDAEIWADYAVDLAQGIAELVKSWTPDVVIVGGGVGAHLEKFAAPLSEELKKYGNNMVPVPPIIKASKAEEAVIYGCYEYIKQNI